MHLKRSSFYNKKIFIYGLAKTGIATLNFLKKKNNQLICWDDSFKIRKEIDNIYLLKKIEKLKNISFDYIVLSPGIDKKKCLFKKFLQKNQTKIISDLDIFYTFNKFNKIISITGTNGKSTTCKLLYDILKLAGHKAQLGGNIGKPVLSLNSSGDSIFVFEISSYQLEYSKYFRSKHSAILNIYPDHLERHKNMKSYIEAKKRIFYFQNKNDFGYYNSNQKSIKINKKIKSKIIKINLNKINKIKNNISNKYLKTQNNLENILFILSILKKLKINEEIIYKGINKFKGLPHRQEEIYHGKSLICINDSKATSFNASIQALKSYKNIFWFLGGAPKKNDIINFKDVKKNIVQAYIIGKNKKVFIKKLKNKIKYIKCDHLNEAFSKVIEDIKFFKRETYNNKIPTLLFSPASASFDIYKNFEVRGEKFRKLFKNNKKKLINV